MSSFPAKIIVDYDVISKNIYTVKKLIPENVEIMAIVKADAYGHGIVESSKAALKGGATWLGVAKISEAFYLREELKKLGLNPRIFSWIYGVDADFEGIINHNLDVSITTAWEVEKLVEAAKKLGIKSPVKVQIKVDTGFSRNGFTKLTDEFSKALELLKNNKEYIEVEGVWSHLAWADDPNLKDAVNFTEKQIQNFKQWVTEIKNEGFNIKYEHILASAGILNYKETVGNIVRPGIIMYGISPNSDTFSQKELENKGFIPAMTLKARINNVKKINAGSGVSYSQTYKVENDTYIGIIPLGYADGIIRMHKDEPLIWVESDKKLVKIAGHICMDQLIVDLGEKTNAKAGDWVTIFGKTPASDVNKWAKTSSTIAYEVLVKTKDFAKNML